jgi:hypothetical protein
MLSSWKVSLVVPGQQDTEQDHPQEPVEHEQVKAGASRPPGSAASSFMHCSSMGAPLLHPDFFLGAVPGISGSGNSFFLPCSSLAAPLLASSSGAVPPCVGSGGSSFFLRCSSMGAISGPGRGRQVFVGAGSGSGQGRCLCAAPVWVLQRPCSACMQRAVPVCNTRASSFFLRCSDSSAPLAGCLSRSSTASFFTRYSSTGADVVEMVEMVQGEEEGGTEDPSSRRVTM